MPINVSAGPTATMQNIRDNVLSQMNNTDELRGEKNLTKADRLYTKTQTTDTSGVQSNTFSSKRATKAESAKAIIQKAINNTIENSTLSPEAKALAKDLLKDVAKTSSISGTQKNEFLTKQSVENIFSHVDTVLEKAEIRAHGKTSLYNKENPIPTTSAGYTNESVAFVQMGVNREVLLLDTTISHRDYGMNVETFTAMTMFAILDTAINTNDGFLSRKDVNDLNKMIQTNIGSETLDPDVYAGKKLNDTGLENIAQIMYDLFIKPEPEYVGSMFDQPPEPTKWNITDKDISKVDKKFSDLDIENGPTKGSDKLQALRELGFGKTMTGFPTENLENAMLAGINSI